MTTVETILARMMNDQVFAEALLANSAEALAEYDLAADEFEIFKGLSRANFETLASASPEERKSLATQLGAPSGRLYVATDAGVY
jgi:ligand-binding sensor domain-containing protein